MYSEQTYENIKKRILDNVASNVNKNEGSFCNNIVSPQAFELAEAYKELSNTLNMAFLRNNKYNYLDLKVDEWGLSRKEGTKASGQVTFTGVEGTEINNGSWLECDGLRFVLLDDVIIGQNENIGHVEAEFIGIEYNLLANSLLTLTISNDNVDNIVNSVAFSNGSNEETDEELIKRFETYKQKISTSGNKNDYYNWTMEVKNVGDCKVYGAEDLGINGKVKVIIVDSIKTGADANLVNEVKAYIETKRPIGANIEVVSATEKAININATITLADGYTLEQVKSEITKNLTKYLYDTAFTTSYVSVARIGNVILDTIGVFDYSDFTVNGGTNNIALTSAEVAVLGTVVLS